LPRGVAVDGGGNVIVADSRNHRIRKIIPQGQVSTLAGTGEGGHRLASAQFNCPRGDAVDGNGNIIVADTVNHCIRRVASDGVTLRMFLSLLLPPLLPSSFVSDI
jgi:DNA-binding beta-propeller fold protein YncE